MDYNISCCRDYFKYISSQDCALNMWFSLFETFDYDVITSKDCFSLPSAILRGRYHISFLFPYGFEIRERKYDAFVLSCPDSFILEEVRFYE